MENYINVFIIYMDTFLSFPLNSFMNREFEAF